MGLRGLRGVWGGASIVEANENVRANDDIIVLLLLYLEMCLISSAYWPWKK